MRFFSGVAVSLIPGYKPFTCERKKNFSTHYYLKKKKSNLGIESYVNCWSICLHETWRCVLHQNIQPECNCRKDIGGLQSASVFCIRMSCDALLYFIFLRRQRSIYTCVRRTQMSCMKALGKYFVP